MFGFGKIFEFLAPHDCLACGCQGSLLCASCLPRAITPAAHVSAEQLVVSHIWVGGDYSGVLRQLLRKYKFERAADTADLLATVLEAALPALPPGTIVTYVPTATSRVRERGYDHARQLALAVANMRGLKVLPLLNRHGQQRQVGATRADRRRQMASAYTIRRHANLKDVRILLVDDITTTGTTLQIAAKVLMAAGAKSIDAGVVAYKR